MFSKYEHVEMLYNFFTYTVPLLLNNDHISIRIIYKYYAKAIIRIRKLYLSLCTKVIMKSKKGYK